MSEPRTTDLNHFLLTIRFIIVQIIDLVMLVSKNEALVFRDKFILKLTEVHTFLGSFKYFILNEQTFF